MNQTPEAERDLFEAWAEGQYHLNRAPKSHSEYYISVATQHAWEAWQAARAIPQAAAEPVARMTSGRKHIVFEDYFDIHGIRPDPKMIKLYEHPAPDRASSIKTPEFEGIGTPDRAPSIDSATERDAGHPIYGDSTPEEISEFKEWIGRKRAIAAMKGEA